MTKQTTKGELMSADDEQDKTDADHWNCPLRQRGIRLTMEMLHDLHFSDRKPEDIRLMAINLVQTLTQMMCKDQFES
jgi:hypothetical protein